MKAVGLCKRTTRVAVSLSALLIGSQARAQAMRCDTTLTIGQCRTLLTSDSAGRAAQVAATASNLKAQAASASAVRSTGGDNPASVPSTSITNYLPRLAAAITAPGLSGDTAALGLNLNIPLNDGFLFHYGVVVQIGVVAHRPKLFSQLVDSLPTANRDAMREKLESTLNDLDDAELTLAVSADNKRFGRRFANHEAELDSLAAKITAQVDADLVAVLRAEQSAQNHLVYSAIANDAECKNTDLDAVPLTCFAPRSRDEFINATLATAAAQAEVTTESKRLFQKTGFDRIGDLVDNQPQASLSFFTRNRRDIAGPSSFGATAKFEYGFANLNGLRRSCHGKLETECFENYMNNPRVASSLARGDRVALTVDFTSQPKYNVARKDTVSLSLTPSWNLAPTATYGLYLGKQPDGRDKGRLDTKVQYVREFKDAHRQSRSIIQMMLTEPVSEQSSALFAITWANKPEFIGQADAKIRANVGLSYHLVSQPK